MLLFFSASLAEVTDGLAFKPSSNYSVCELKSTCQEKTGICRASAWENVDADLPVDALPALGNDPTK